MTFGELSEEATDKRKYAKYKAAYIHTCLRNGETPIPGPPNEDGESDENNAMAGPSNPSDNTEDNVTPPEAPADQPEPSTPNEPHSPIEFTPHPTEINGTHDSKKFINLLHKAPNFSAINF